MSAVLVLLSEVTDISVSSAGLSYVLSNELESVPSFGVPYEFSYKSSFEFSFESSYKSTPELSDKSIYESFSICSSILSSTFSCIYSNESPGSYISAEYSSCTDISGTISCTSTLFTASSFFGSCVSSVTPRAFLFILFLARSSCLSYFS